MPEILNKPWSFKIALHFNRSVIASALRKAEQGLLFKLSQKSTMAGMILLACAAVGHHIDTTQADEIASACATVASGLLILMNDTDKGGPKAA